MHQVCAVAPVSDSQTWHITATRRNVALVKKNAEKFHEIHEVSVVFDSCGKRFRELWISEAWWSNPDAWPWLWRTDESQTPRGGDLNGVDESQ